MGFSRYYFKECNFVLTKITGEINDSELAEHVKALNNETRGLVNFKELADCREITKINLTTHGTTSNASNEENKPGSRGAILVPEGNDLIFAMARAYQMFCEEHRESVRIFRDYNEALTWLANDDSLEVKALNDFINNA